MLARTSMIVMAAVGLTAPVLAVDPDRDFSGKWIFDSSSSNTRNIPAPRDRVLKIEGQDNVIVFSFDNAAQFGKLSLDGKATRYKLGEESYNSETKWEGSALLINTIVSGPKDYSLLDRWTLSRDRNVLVIER